MNYMVTTKWSTPSLTNMRVFDSWKEAKKYGASLMVEFKDAMMGSVVYYKMTDSGAKFMKSVKI